MLLKKHLKIICHFTLFSHLKNFYELEHIHLLYNKKCLEIFVIIVIVRTMKDVFLSLRYSLCRIFWCAALVLVLPIEALETTETHLPVKKSSGYL